MHKTIMEWVQGLKMDVYFVTIFRVGIKVLNCSETGLVPTITTDSLTKHYILCHLAKSDSPSNPTSLLHDEHASKVATKFSHQVL